MKISDDWCPEDILDGAVLFDGGLRLSRNGVVSYAHTDDRLGLVRYTGGHFRAEYFFKTHPVDEPKPYWAWHTPFAFCDNEQDAQNLIEQYVAEGKIPQRLTTQSR